MHTGHHMGTHTHTYIYIYTYVYVSCTHALNANVCSHTGSHERWAVRARAQHVLNGIGARRAVDDEKREGEADAAQRAQH